MPYEPKEVHYDIFVDSVLRLKIRLYKNDKNALCHDFHMTPGVEFQKHDVFDDIPQNRLPPHLLN